MARRIAVLLVAAAVASLLGAPAANAITTSLDGPSADVLDAQEVDVAASPDGFAAVAWLRKVGGVDRVFVSRLTAGGWSAPIQADANLAAGSAAGVPSVGVAGGGRLVVLFPSGPAAKKRLYAAIAPSVGEPLGPAQPASADEEYWSRGARLALAPNGDGYAIMRTEPAGNPNLHALRLQGTTWTPVGAAFPGGTLDATEANPVAEDDVHAADVAVSRDGAAATVVFTETLNAGQYQLYARRLTGTTAGPAVPATAPTDTLGGAPISDLASDMADVAIDGAGTAWIAFRQAFTYGAQQRFRGIARPFDGAAFGPIQVTDGQGAAPAENVEYHALAVNAAGRGLAATYRGTTNVAEAAFLDAGSWLAPALPVSPGPAEGASRASAAMSDTGAGHVAFRHDPAGGAGPVVLGRIRAAGAFEGAVQLSEDGFGVPGPPTRSAASDIFAVTAFTQGAGASARVVAAIVLLPQPPAAPPAAPPTGPAVAGDTTAPVLTGLRVTPAAFRTGRRPATIAPSAGRAPAAIRLTLSEPATVGLSAERLRSGRRARGGRCVAPTRRNRGARRCVRAVAGRDRVLLALPAGTSRLRFAGRLARVLAPGSYRLVAVAVDAAGNRGAARRAAFRVLAPARR